MGLGDGKKVDQEPGVGCVEFEKPVRPLFDVEEETECTALDLEGNFLGLAQSSQWGVGDIKNFELCKGLGEEPRYCFYFI